MLRRYFHKFELEKLECLKQQHLSNSDNSDLAEFLKQNSSVSKLPSAATMNSFADAYKARVNTLYELLENFNSLYADTFTVDDTAAKKFLKPEISAPFQDLLETFEKVQWDAESIQQSISSACDKHNIGFGKIGQPLRVALTGSKFGPGIYDIIISLGKEEVTKRLTNKKLS